MTLIEEFEGPKRGVANEVAMMHYRWVYRQRTSKRIYIGMA